MSATIVHVLAFIVFDGPMPAVTQKSTARIELTLLATTPTPPTTPLATPAPPKRPEARPPCSVERRLPSESADASREVAEAPQPEVEAVVAPMVPRMNVNDENRRMSAAIRGAAQGPLPSLATLERATGVKTVGPESDSARASRLAKAHLERDMSEHDVARGLADDWFRRRRADVARLWNPNERELIDGGKQVRATELALRTPFNPLLWNEASKLIAGDGAAVAQAMTDLNRAREIEQMMTTNARPNETDGERRARLRGALATHKEAFATRVGLEVSVRHRPDGAVESIEVTSSSGHDLVDEGAVDAVARALALDPTDTAPASVARGQPFFTRWSLEVKWALNVPKCSVLASGTGATAQMAAGDSLPIGCGTSFGNDGVDVPFTVKKDRNVELISIERL